MALLWRHIGLMAMAQVWLMSSQSTCTFPSASGVLLRYVSVTTWEDEFQPAPDSIASKIEFNPIGCRETIAEVCSSHQDASIQKIAKQETCKEIQALLKMIISYENVGFPLSCLQTHKAFPKVLGMWHIYLFMSPQPAAAAFEITPAGGRLWIDFLLHLLPRV